MDSIRLIRAINRIAKDHFSSRETYFNPTPYLEECLDSLREYFRAELKGDYLFSALTLKKSVPTVERKDEEGIEIISRSKNEGYHFRDDVVEGTFEPIIGELIQAVENKSSISLTRSLLKDSHGKLLFFYSEKEYDSPINPFESEDSKLALFSLSWLRLNPDGREFDRFLDANRRFIEKFKKMLTGKECLPEENLQQEGKLLWYYKKLQEAYRPVEPDKDFVVHFIRPAFIEFDHNVLLSLATSRQLEPHQLAFIALLIYRIVGQMAIEKTKEIEELRRKRSFSLTTHSLKTELNTTIVPQIGMVKDALRETPFPERLPLHKYVDDLERQGQNLFYMTGLITLVDKIGDKDTFVSSGLKQQLLVKAEEAINISQYCEEYNARNRRLAEIVISGAPDQSLSIKVYGVYLSRVLVKLFVDTIFENISLHGRRRNKKVELRVSHSDHVWTFENDTRIEKVEVDVSRLSGNLLLFQTFIEDTKSGTLVIDSGNHLFKVTCAFNT